MARALLRNTNGCVKKVYTLHQDESLGHAEERGMKAPGCPLSWPANPRQHR